MASSYQHVLSCYVLSGEHAVVSRPLRPHPPQASSPGVCGAGNRQADSVTILQKGKYGNYRTEGRDMARLIPKGPARPNGTESLAEGAQTEGTALEKTQSRLGRGRCVRNSGL